MSRSVFKPYKSVTLKIIPHEIDEKIFSYIIYFIQTPVQVANIKVPTSP